MNNTAQILTSVKPKLGFAGVGWIGKNRLQAIRKTQVAEIKSVIDPDSRAVSELQEEVRSVQEYSTFDEMLESDIDGVVIATPSALHASQSLAALKKGKAVFCQKPLGRNSREAAEVVEAARLNNTLLGMDLSYRYTDAVQQVKKVIESGELGNIYGVNLVFHNAYGPDKEWYFDAEQSGGGCVMDLGIHLADLLFWLLDNPKITDISSQLFHQGKRLDSIRTAVEDYAVAQMSIDDNTAVQFSCSWNLPAGKDAVLEAVFYGENGGVAFRNVDGSFYNFIAERYEGTSTHILSEPPDDWEGRAVVRWSEKLAEGNKFDPECESYVHAARALDLIYNHCSS